MDRGTYNLIDLIALGCDAKKCAMWGDISRWTGRGKGETCCWDAAFTLWKAAPQGFYDASFIVTRPDRISAAAIVRCKESGSPRKLTPTMNAPSAPMPVQIM